MSLSSRLSVDDVPGGGKPEADAVALLDVDEALTIISRSGPLSAILVLQGEVRAGEGGISEVASAMKAMGKKPTALSRLIPRPPNSTPTVWTNSPHKNEVRSLDGILERIDHLPSVKPEACRRLENEGARELVKIGKRNGRLLLHDTQGPHCIITRRWTVLFLEMRLLLSHFNSLAAIHLSTLVAPVPRGLKRHKLSTEGENLRGPNSGYIWEWHFLERKK